MAVVLLIGSIEQVAFTQVSNHLQTHGDFLHFLVFPSVIQGFAGINVLMLVALHCFARVPGNRDIVGTFFFSLDWFFSHFSRVPFPVPLLSLYMFQGLVHIHHFSNGRTIPSSFRYSWMFVSKQCYLPAAWISQASCGLRISWLKTRQMSGWK